MKQKKRKVKKNWLLWGLCMSLILLIIASELMIMLLLRQGLVKFSSLPGYLLEVTSDSMYPDIRTGDCVLVDKTPFDQVREGDIICYESLGNLITHRVVEVTQGALITKGDYNPVEDPPVTSGAYRGKVIRVIPRLGRLFSLQRTPMGCFTLAALLTVLFFGKDFYLFLLDLGERRGKNAP